MHQNEIIYTICVYIFYNKQYVYIYFIITVWEIMMYRLKEKYSLGL